MLFRSDLVRSRAIHLHEALPQARELLSNGRLGEARKIVDDILFGQGGATDPRDLLAISEAHQVLSARRRVRAKSRSTDTRRSS